MLFHSIIPRSQLFYLGFMFFRLICYSLFIWLVFPKYFKDTIVNPIIPAISRTVLGFVCVVGYSRAQSIFSFIAKPAYNIELDSIGFILFLICFVICFLLSRVAYWYIIIWIFYDREQNSVLSDIKLSLFSLLFSFLIDIPSGLFGFVFGRDISLIIRLLVP